MVSNSRTRQDATISSLKVCFKPTDEHICFVFFYTADDMHFDKISECYGISTAVYRDYSDLTQSAFNKMVQVNFQTFYTTPL